MNTFIVSGGSLDTGCSIGIAFRDFRSVIDAFFFWISSLSYSFCVSIGPFSYYGWILIIVIIIDPIRMFAAKKNKVKKCKHTDRHAISNCVVRVVHGRFVSKYNVDNGR